MDPFTSIIIFLVSLIVIFLAKSSYESWIFYKNTDSRKFHKSSLVRVLLNLPDSTVNELLQIYKREFGPGPARYARRTFRKWREGHVQPATQTFDRFLVHMPKVMSYDMKCEVLRHFMEEYAAKDVYELDVTTAEWEQKLDPLVRQIIDKAFNAQLPDEVERQLKWLGDGDMVAAQSILRASQAEESRIMVSMLHNEFLAMDELLDQQHLKPRVTHVLEFPYGTIKMNVRRAPRNG
ncbi:MAG TPA: hypothetical protein VFZ49_01220 [Pyrinomonadaceae bacterium]